MAPRDLAKGRKRNGGKGGDKAKGKGKGKGKGSTWP